MVSKMKGSTGTIKSMALHPKLPYLGTVGNDRYLRIYNLNSKKATFKLYVGQRLSSLLFSKEEMANDYDVSEEEDIEAVKPMQEKIQIDFKKKKHTIKLSYLKNEQFEDQEIKEEPAPKLKKKIKKNKKNKK